jgi:pSer/pThr/pTyr-binding forkhead associated (FHA) protein
VSELTLTLLRLGFLALLWILVLSVAAVMRRDIFGARVTRRGSVAARSTHAPAPAASSPSAGAAGASPHAGAPAAPRAERRPDSLLLVVTAGSLEGTTLTLGQAPVLIGRAPECTLVIEDDYASSRHARLFLRDGSWYVEDLGSTNGTFIGKTRLTAPTRIEIGVPVRIGRTVLELRR